MILSARPLAVAVALAAVASVVLGGAARAATFRALSAVPANSLLAGSGSVLAASTPADFKLSRDAGVTWTRAISTTYGTMGVSVGPDGAFYTSRLRVAPDGQSTWLSVQAPPGADSTGRAYCASPPVWDAHGQAWMAFCTTGNDLIVGRATIAAPVNGISQVHIDAVGRGGDLFGCGDSNDPLEAAAGDGYLVFGCDLYKFNADEVLRVSADGTTGMGWPGTDQRRVAGSGDLWLAGSGDTWRYHARAYRRQGAFWLPTDGAAANAWQATQTTVGLLVRIQPNDSFTTWGLIEGPLGPAGDVGPLDARGHAMVERLNVYRAQADLPPVLYDGRMAQAALNHARYLAAHGWGTGGQAHHETAGQSGFTGDRMVERCAATGASCSAEVIASAGGPGAVDQLMNTVFHRWILLDKSYGSAGPSPEGAGVIDLGGDISGWRVTEHPTVWPAAGTYDGPLSFGGGEWPDPLEGCPTSSSHSTPITAQQIPGWNEYTNGPAAISLRRVADGRALTGCSRVDETGPYLIADQALTPGTAYEATVTWDTGAYTWRFTTTGTLENDTDGTSGGCRPTVTVARRATRRTGLKVRTRACAEGRLTITFRRLLKRRGKIKRAATAALTARVSIAKAGRASTTVKLRRLKLARYAVAAKLTGGAVRSASATRTLTVRAR